MGDLTGYLFDPKDISEEMRPYFEETETQCGSPWARVVEKSGGFQTPDEQLCAKEAQLQQSGHHGKGTGLRQAGWSEQQPSTVTTTGWTPTCSHYDALYYSDFAKPKDPRKWAQRAMSGNWFKRARKRPGLPGWPVDPCTVLDPFFGSGTTGQVALKLGRRAVGVELSQKYCDEHIIPRLSKGIQMEMTL